jgi:hypothetical protein
MFATPLDHTTERGKFPRCRSDQISPLNVHRAGVYGSSPGFSAKPTTTGWDPVHIAAATGSEVSSTSTTELPETATRIIAPFRRGTSLGALGSEPGMSGSARVARRAGCARDEGRALRACVDRIPANTRQDARRGSDLRSVRPALQLAGICGDKRVSPPSARAAQMQLDRNLAHYANKKVVICRSFMERTGIEPVTSGLQSRRSPS